MQTSDHWSLPIFGSCSSFYSSFNRTAFPVIITTLKEKKMLNMHYDIQLKIFWCYQLSKKLYLNFGGSFFIGSAVVLAAVPPFFLSIFLCDLPFRNLRNDSLNDFLSDFLRDIGLSSALAMSKNSNRCFSNWLNMGSYL